MLKSLFKSDVPDWQSKTFLIVEDEKTNFRYIQALLQKTKVEILWAHDGIEAINICKTNKQIDLVLMDIKLPGKNGYAATKEILKHRSNLPIIAQTAYALSGDEDRSLEAGCVAYISKPFKSKDLIEIINTHL